MKGLFETLGIETSDAQLKVSAIIDKLEKIGEDKVIDLLQEAKIDRQESLRLLQILTMRLTTNEYLEYLATQHLNRLFEEGVNELAQVVKIVRGFGVEDEYFGIDLSIARGLEYYTGIVYETRFNAYPDLGSIASGGRYDNLTESFSNKHMSGVGISIGVTRLLLRLIKVGLISVSKSTVAKVIVTTAEGISENFSFYLQCAQMLRKANIATEVYMLDSKLGKQMEFANKRGFTLAIIAKAPNIETGTVVVRNLEIGDQKEVTLDQLIPTVLEMLN